MPQPKRTQHDTALWRLIKRFQNNESGVSAIEFAMIGSFVLILFLSILDIAFYMYRKMEVSNAVRAGAQYALVNTDRTVANIANVEAKIIAVVQGATPFTINTITVDMDVCGCSDGTLFACSAVGSTCTTPPTSGRRHEYTTISAAYSHTGIFYPGPYNITAQATIRRQ